ncbi:MAG: ASCH domain-containing protein [Elusimicrobia bacterium]|nr:ASCH domain-containing protein [Elusimicrobiota bacterium]MDE2511325.1 ASCH domain-containing protein [Elusimicrobiota bacterium]
MSKTPEIREFWRNYRAAAGLDHDEYDVVVIDGRGRPRCVWRTTEVTVKPLLEADAVFAWDEGEGDRTLPDWLEGHRRCFRRQAAREGFDFHDGLETVFERFQVVWPPEAADKSGKD